MRIKSKKRYIEPGHGLVEVDEIIDVIAKRGKWLVKNE